MEQTAEAHYTAKEVLALKNTEVFGSRDIERWLKDYLENGDYWHFVNAWLWSYVYTKKAYSTEGRIPISHLVSRVPAACLVSKETPSAAIKEQFLVWEGLDKDIQEIWNSFFVTIDRQWRNNERELIFGLYRYLTGFYEYLARTARLENAPLSKKKISFAEAIAINCEYHLTTQ